MSINPHAIENLVDRASKWSRGQTGHIGEKEIGYVAGAADERKIADAQLHRLNRHKELMKNTWLSVNAKYDSLLSAVKEYFDSGATGIETYEKFLDEYDLD